MNNKMIFTLLVALIVVILMGLVISDYLEPASLNPYFENEKKDSLSSMIDQVEVYRKGLIEKEFFLYERPVYDTFVTSSSYTRDEFDDYPVVDDVVELFPSYYDLKSVNYILESVESMPVNCLVYEEGDRCNFIFGRKWAEIQMNDKQLYINYYREHKSSFLEERHEWENFEMYFDMIDDKVSLAIGVNSYNILSNYYSESSYYFVEDMYLEVFQRGMYHNYMYSKVDYVTGDYFVYDDASPYMRIEYYNKDSNSHIMYLLLDDEIIEMEYTEFNEDYEEIFAIGYPNDFIRFNMMYVGGWDRLDQLDGSKYQILYENNNVTNDINAFISGFGTVTPRLFLNLHNVVLEDTIVDLSRFNLSSDYILQDVENIKVYYETHTLTILREFGLSGDIGMNRRFIDTKIINENDSDLIKGFE